MEQFVATLGDLLAQEGCEVRVLACRRPGEDSTADATVPARYLGSAGWPLPTGGWATVWREAGQADAVVANNALHVLSAVAVLAGRRRRVPSLLVIHGSGQGVRPGARGLGTARAAFQRTLGGQAVRRSLPVSVSRAGVAGARRAYGVEAEYLPFPLPELPEATPLPAPAAGEAMRVVWIGRLAPEKDPLSAVQAVDSLSAHRPVALDIYGDGPLRSRLEALAAQRSWLTVRGARPWPEVVEAQGHAHACLSTSVWDNVQVAVLEALARGVPVISTRVGDAPHYYAPPLERWCVEPGDPDESARALGALAVSYDDNREAFAANGHRLQAIHRDAPRVLMELIALAGSRRP